MIDRDGDGIQDPDDNCPNFPNPAQVDQDGDGLGDMCDRCVHDPMNDSDGDGVCDFDANGRLDNCPYVPNPTQTNCNEDSEIAEGAEVLGDACEPVPCPKFSTESRLVHEANNPIYRYQVSEVTNIVHTPLGARPRAGGNEVAVSVSRSLYRYCIDDNEFGNRCHESRFTNFQLAEEVAFRGEETRSNVWHRITLGSDPSGELGALTYRTGERRSRQWSWLADFDAWRSGPVNLGNWLPDPRAVLNANPRELPIPDWGVSGRLWILGDTGVGVSQPAAQGPRANWIHLLEDGQELPPERDRALASHYQLMSPLQVRSKAEKAPTRTPVPLAFCKHCPEALGIPSIEECPVCSLPGLTNRDPRILTLVRQAELVWLGVAGELYPTVEQELSQSLASKLTQPGWVAAAEPNAELGVGLTSPAAVQVSADGTQVLNSVYTLRERVVDAGELAELRQLIVGGDGLLAHPLMSVQGDLLPPSRTGTHSAYSRARAQLAVVGGLEPGVGPSREVWLYDLQHGLWDVIEGVELGNVRALSWAKAGLFVVDVVGSGWQRRARLVLIDPVLREVSTVTEWPYLGLFESHHLAADQDGELLLAASSKLLRTHAVARLALGDEQVQLQGFRLGAGELSYRPVVDAYGYTLLVSDRAGKVTPERKERLFSSSGNWHDLGRCF